MDILTLILIILIVFALAGGGYSVFHGSAPGGIVTVLLLLLLVFLLVGCAVGERLVDHTVPTARYCHEVHYDRVGNAVSLAAECTVPWGPDVPPGQLPFGGL